MRVLLLVLLALPAMAQRPDRQQRCDRRDRLCASDASVFRLLPASYAIPGGECSGQAITGSRGEVITVTRPSNTTCTKSDGTVVTLTSDQPAVSLLNGVPVLWRYASATNSLQQSQTLEHASWSKSAATVTADTTTAPDNTTTADRICQTATTAAHLVFNATAAFGTQRTGSMFFKADGARYVAITTPGNLQVGIFDLQTCTVFSSSGTGASARATLIGSYCRPELTEPGSAGSTFNLYLGNATATIISGDAGSTSACVVAWGGQVEPGTIATPYIPTTGTSATRSAEVVSVAKPASVTDTVGCEAATIAAGNTAFATRILFYAGGTGLLIGSSTSVGQSDGAAVVSSTVSNILNRRVDAIGRWSSNQQVTVDGVSSSGTYDGAFLQSTLYIGGDSSGSAASMINGPISNIRLAPTTTGCER